ncbi:hypothetical protein BpHYR1_027782 [Brachionus plicatilis]|uniref:Uncharacterized protein n=1 Tax=Brachionus plicatilis TaxID=10195 RepID=A0A3M7RUL6_BRAPC|nr:hypothetical protein BpHYR1_027782 [Brachionus plicatilis]
MSTSDLNSPSTDFFQTSSSDALTASIENIQASIETSTLTNKPSELPMTDYTGSEIVQTMTESLVTTILQTKETSTFQSVIPNVSTSTAISFTTSTIQNNTSRVVGILVTFGLIGIFIVLGFLFYVWRKTKLEENKYITLADRLNAQSSRPPSPNVANMNEDMFVNNLASETVFSNPAFNLQERSGKDDNFKFDFDDITNEKRNNESDL